MSVRLTVVHSYSKSGDNQIKKKYKPRDVELERDRKKDFRDLLLHERLLVRTWFGLELPVG
jgi:hypothetical protein